MDSTRSWNLPYNERSIFRGNNFAAMNSRFRQLSVTLSRVLIGAMLFAQSVNAAQACVMPELSPAMAFAQAAHDMDCDNRVNANSCLQQATATDQSSSQVEIAVLGMPDVVILTLPREFEDSPSFVIAATALPCSTDPPASIRFCSFQL